MQSQKMHMSKKQFRIGDLAKELKVKKFVVRFWEKEFGIKSDRSGGGQRFYTTEDLKIFFLIKDLLYNQGFTIAGAKKQLSESGHSGSTILEDQSIGHATQDLNNTTEDFVEYEAQAIPVQDAQALQSAVAVMEEMVTPATLVPCACSTVVEKLGPLKEQLAQLKALLEQPISR